MKMPIRYRVRCNYCNHIQSYRSVCEMCERYIYDSMTAVKDDEE